MGTAAGGELVVLDSAGYGPVNITQAVSITAPPGVYAGISVFSGNGITINAGSMDIVILRGLAINNQGSTGNGIFFNTGAVLHVENCAINGFQQSGASFGIQFAGAGKLEVKDSTITNNLTGIFVLPATGTASASIDHVRVESNGLVGVAARQGSKVTVRNSLASNNGDAGFSAASQTAATAELNLENCVASNNNTGVIAISLSTGVATVRLSNSTVTDNTTFGLDNVGAPAVLLSRGNNTVEGNGTDTMGTIGSYTAK